MKYTFAHLHCINHATPQHNVRTVARRSPTALYHPQCTLHFETVRWLECNGRRQDQPPPSPPPLSLSLSSARCVRRHRSIRLPDICSQCACENAERKFVQIPQARRVRRAEHCAATSIVSADGDRPFGNIPCKYIRNFVKRQHFVIGLSGLPDALRHNRNGQITRAGVWRNERETASQQNTRTRTLAHAPARTSRAQHSNFRPTFSFPTPGRGHRPSICALICGVKTERAHTHSHL